MTQKVQDAVRPHNLAVSIGKSTLFGIVARLAQIGTRLITIPVVIGHLGLGGYGIWSIIMTVSAYMRFGSVGMKSAFQKYVAEATGNESFERVNKLLSTGCAVMLLLSIVGLIPSALFSKKLAAAAGVPLNFLDAAANSIAILAFIMLLSNVGAVYEAIVMGGHRIDLVRKYSTFFSVAEAVAIVFLLRRGYGLTAMTVVMAISEIGYIGCCYWAAGRLLPQVRLSSQYVHWEEVRELVRFAGSYQLVNVLEVLYAAILPVTILREFGAAASGVYAIAQRLAGSAAMLPDAFLHPILSGGSMVYASGSQETMKRLIAKAYKITLGLSLLPLGFLSIFGSLMVFAWTGQDDHSFRLALAIVSLTTLFACFSILGLVLYRVSGRALLDNIRQIVRIATLLVIALFSRHIGFYGVLVGWAVAEFLGMMFMLYALTATFPGLRFRDLLPDTIRLIVAIALILGAAVLASYMPLPGTGYPRIDSLLDLAKVGIASLLALWPALSVTRSVTPAETRALASVILPKKFRPSLSTADGARGSSTL